MKTRNGTARLAPVLILLIVATTGFASPDRVDRPDIESDRVDTVPARASTERDSDLEDLPWLPLRIRLGPGEVGSTPEPIRAAHCRHVESIMAWGCS